MRQMIFIPQTKNLSVYVLDYALIKCLRHKEECVLVSSTGKAFDGWIRDLMLILTYSKN